VSPMKEPLIAMKLLKATLGVLVTVTEAQK
jgi:hypothetical protein